MGLKMSEMKLIMENWKGFVSEQFEACNRGVTIGVFKQSLDLMNYLKMEAL